MSLEGLKPPVKMRSCKIQTIKQNLGNERDVELLETYIMDSDNWSATSLSAALASRGVYVSANTIYKHRNGACAC